METSVERVNQAGDRQAESPRGSTSPNVLGWIALLFSLLWGFGIGSVLGIVLGLRSAIMARREGIKVPTPAIVAIAIGVVSVILIMLSIASVVSLERQ